MKNCDPLVSLPLFAIDKRYSLLCLTEKLSSTEIKIQKDLSRDANGASLFKTKHFSKIIIPTFKESSVDRLPTSTIAYRQAKHTQIIQSQQPNLQQIQRYIVRKILPSLKSPP